MLKHFKPTDNILEELEKFKMYDLKAFSKDGVAPAWATK